MARKLKISIDAGSGTTFLGLLIQKIRNEPVATSGHTLFVVEDRLLGELSGSRRMQIDEDLMNRLPNPLEFIAGCNDRR